MKFKFLFPAVLLSVLMVACSAEMVDRLPSESIDIDESKQVLVIPVDAERVMVMFPIATYANSYAYAVNGGSAVPIDNLAYADGYCSFEINVANEPFEGTIALYASKLENGGDWGEPIATVNYVMSTSDYVPDAFVSRRGPSSVEIRVNETSGSSSRDYLVEITGTGDTSFEKSYEFTQQNVLAINDEEITAEGTYQAKVYLVTSQGVSRAAEMDILAYDDRFNSTMDMNVEESSFVVTNLPESAQSVRLMRVISAAEQEQVLEVEAVGGKVVFSFTDLKSLDSGRFYAVTADGDGYAVSNLLKYTIPIVPQETHIYRKNIVLDVNLIEGAVPTFVVIGPAGVSATYSENRIVISGLSSKTTYDSIELRLTNLEYSTVTPYIMNQITTDTFAGLTYGWDGYFDAFPRDVHSNFVITVEDAPDGSEFPYYVYFADTDAEVIRQVERGQIESGHRLRVMPLVDSSPDLDSSLKEPETSSANPVDFATGMAGSIDFRQQNTAYKVNSVKWNKLARGNLESDLMPSDWYISNADSNPDKDIVTTITWSTALSVPNETLTTFEFGERVENGVALPYVRFANIPGEGMAGMGLYENANPQNEEFGDSMTVEEAKYNWYLTPVAEEV